MAPNWDLAFAVVPRVAAFFSLLGSGFIVYEVISDVKKRRKVYHRIMCGMSCFDIIGSICYFLGRWPMPADGLSGFGLSGGVGTEATCKTQAFFGQAVVGTVTYNAVLAVQYFMIVNLSMSETTIAKKYEKIMHAIPFFMWIATAIIGLSFGALNPAFFNCWITPAPINCAAAGEIPDGRPPCERGYYAPILQWAIFYGPIWALIIIVTFIMASVYASVRKLEKANSKYTGSQTSTKADSAKRSRMVAKQGLWYLFPFYATWVFPVATEITEMVTAQYFNPMVILVAFFLPFQGALNFIIYMRPRFIKYRKKHQSWNICYIIYRTVRKSLCCIAKDEDDMFVSGIGANTSVVSRTSVLNRESAVAEYNRRNTIDAKDQTIEPTTRKSSVTFADGEDVDAEEEKVEEGEEA